MIRHKPGQAWSTRRWRRQEGSSSGGSDRTPIQTDLLISDSAPISDRYLSLRQIPQYQTESRSQMDITVSDTPMLNTPISVRHADLRQTPQSQTAPKAHPEATHPWQRGGLSKAITPPSPRERRTEADSLGPLPQSAGWENRGAHVPAAQSGPGDSPV